MKNKYIQIAIDGPAGSGKSTIAKKVSSYLKNGIYINTGLMYRAVAYFLLTNNININDESAINNFLELFDVELDANSVYIIFNNKKIDVSKQVCNENIGQIASKISSFKNVRDKLVANQQKIAENANVVMDGRDIGTVVLPNATLKIFLDASIAKRAKRRLIQLNTIGYKRVDVLENLKSNTELFSSTVETKEMFLNTLCFFMLLKFKDVNYQIERNFTTDINYYNFLWTSTYSDFSCLSYKKCLFNLNYEENIYFEKLFGYLASLKNEELKEILKFIQKIFPHSHLNHDNYKNTDMMYIFKKNFQVLSNKKLIDLLSPINDLLLFNELDVIVNEIKARDENDKNRQFGPLKQAQDAHVIDTDNLTINRICAEIISLLEAKLDL